MAHADENGLLNHELRIKNVKKALTKLSEEDKEWIKQNYIPNNPQFGTKALSEKFKVSRGYISNIGNSR
ncbi:hypothetical protein PQE71_gp239 [Bacillus phage Izhevsk]|uniref:Uncharacterized protein n=1 Tax=Bacillus phage Izhevsk TaxID=2724322 RepID=A0A6H0X6K6_9CAUD|nr:hypothetical protein PQE71_gp239 [Bacillus phage Izhevsk]QIW89926.1 hypothetical protein Izhevsk_245 [Bacillus phage Izhevsk]